MFSVAIHGHFYQPPRENPWLNTIEKDISAAPFHNWNERVCSECYKPMSEAVILGSDGRIISTVNNYSHMSFNFGPTLHKWIEERYPALNRTITSSGERAIAQCYSHMIMPLASSLDKKTQVVWGIKDFAYRFGHNPEGMWIPETAVDTETLESLAKEGITFTILASNQCAAVEYDSVWHEINGGEPDTTLPYLCELPSGRTINIIFYNGRISHDIAFGGLLENGDRFYDSLINSMAVKDEDRILVAAVDGETYGHHHKFGEMALARLFTRLTENKDVDTPSIGDFLKKHPPLCRCKIKENTSWSCMHGIERWRSDCGCHTGGMDSWNGAWRAPLRAAFDNLAAKTDEIFDKYVSCFADPWILRNEAIHIYLADADSHKRKNLFAKEFLGAISEKEAANVFSLLEAQRMRMFMYTSCAWFFNDISGVETRQAISYALRAAQITEAVSGADLTKSLVSDLYKVKGNTDKVPNAGIIIDNYIEKHSNFSKKKSVLPFSKDESAKPPQEGGKSMTGMNYGGNLAQSLLSTLERDPAFRNIAYFSMEIGLNPDIPTYSGGLGILAGDILKSASDLGVPMIGMTLLYKKGYFAQKMTEDGRQTERPVEWNPSKFLTKLPNQVTLTMNGRNVTIGVWTLTLTGESGHPLPIFFLDTDIQQNTCEDRALTAELYGGDNKYRLCQELILGIGGLRLLRDMGFTNIKTFHLNEGHAGFITLELLREQGYGDIEKVKNQVIFTTHTPVAAGHDFFSYDLIESVVEPNFASILKNSIGGSGLSMTDLALKFSRYVNGVSRRHAEVSRAMFSDENIDWITNGVHSATWTSPCFAKLYDENIPGWRNDPSRLMQAVKLKDDDVWRAHQAAKMKLFAHILEETGEQLNPDILTVGFARRAATYKRANLIFSDIKRLLEIGEGRLQLVFSGKAHPHDEPGKDVLQKICTVSKELGKKIPVIFLENYNMAPAKLLTSGTDLWLNTPVRPREASGTSGMKCVHNGIMNFSVLDGWWIEGCIEGVTGWSVGLPPKESDANGYDESTDALSLYDKLEEFIIPTYYRDRKKWIYMMKSAISINASYFNTHRVVREYCEKAYGTVFRGH